MTRRTLTVLILLAFTYCRSPEKEVILPDSPGSRNELPSSIVQKQSIAPSLNRTENSSRVIHRAGKKKEKGVRPNSAISRDSALPAQREQALRIGGIRRLPFTPDLNESYNRNIIGGQNSRPFTSMIELSPEVILQVNFDNDILNYTDRFYTNGIRIALVAPLFQANPVSKLLLPFGRPARNYYGIAIVQNMFTPSTTKTGGIHYGDRPYAACLYAGFFKVTNDSAGLTRQTSELDLGIIGPGSYGEWVQRSFHNSVPTNNEPLGWEYQVQNDIVINYIAGREKGISLRGPQELILQANASLGTLHTNLSAGFSYRIGRMIPYFTSLGISRHREGTAPFRYFFFLKSSGRLVGYDATLQGGLFNKSSTYVIPAGDIARLVYEGSCGISFSYRGIGLDIEQFILSPEFEGGDWHKWVHLALNFAL